MIVQNFYKVYEENPKVVLELYKEIYGTEKDTFSKEELKDLFNKTMDMLKELLGSEDINDALNSFLDDIGQFRYAHYMLGEKMIILSGIAHKENNEILKKYIKSKDNEKVAKIIYHLGTIEYLSKKEEVSNWSVVNVKLEDPEKKSSEDHKSETKEEQSSKQYTQSSPNLSYVCLASIGVGGILGWMIQKTTFGVVVGSIFGCIISGIYMLTKKK